MDHSVKIDDLTYERLENLKHEARITGKRKIYVQHIIGFAVGQIKSCGECSKKFQRWIKDQKS